MFFMSEKSKELQMLLDEEIQDTSNSDNAQQPKENSERIEIISKIDFFDFLKMFFLKNSKWDLLTNKVKESHAFLLFRFLSIQYPREIQKLNGIYNPAVIDGLRMGFTGEKVPYWVYTKSGKPSKSGFDGIDKKSVISYCDFYQIDLKTLQTYQEFFPDSFQSEISKFIKDNSQGKFKKEKNVKKSNKNKKR